MRSLRFAFRSLRKTPGFTAVGLLTLALGIGVNTSMYTLLDVLLFRTAPFPEPEQLVMIQGTTRQGQREGFSFQEVEEMRAQAVAAPDTAEGAKTSAFESITTFSGWNNTLAEPGRPAERLQAIDATADFFTTFRVQPVLGRAFTAEEQVPGKNQVALLSHSLWQSRFGGSPDIIGRSIRLNAEQVTVIGVMPPDFNYIFLFGDAALWRPITIPRFIVEDRHNRFFAAVGRLNPGIDARQAHAQLAPLLANWAQDHPQSNSGRGLSVRLLHKAVMDSTSEFIAWFLLGVGILVLLIACFNLANLQLARATANTRDLAIRSALGASRGRLIGHQLTESLVLAFGGGLCGVILGSWLNRILAQAIRIGNSGTHLDLSLNLRVVLLAFAAAAATGLLFGLLPAWLASRHDVVTTLKQQARGSTSGRGPRLVRHTLIVLEVALALAMLGSAGVMIRGLEGLLHTPKGWDTDRVLIANIHLPEQSRYAEAAKRVLATEQLLQRLARIPGAEQTGICTVPPLFGYSKVNPVQTDGMAVDDPSRLPRAGFTMIAGDYFKTIGLPLREGRTFAADIKMESPPVIIINETMARHFWPGESAIGKRIGERQGDDVNWREVIGVVPDVQMALNIANPDTMFQVYKPMVHEPWGYMNLMVRGPVPAAFKQEVRQAVADIDPDVAVQDMYTVPEAAERFQHNLHVINDTLAGFALLGLILAAVGLYGVISHLVAQRTPEFGIRLALGARPRAVLGLVLRTGLVLSVIGLALGTAIGVALNLALRSAMPRMAPLDPAILGFVALALFVVALFACWWPARRATQVDPLSALRAE